MRQILGMVVFGVLTFGLTGCTVPTNGITGVSVDDAGNLVVVLAWCGRQPDEVIIYHDRVNTTPVEDVPADLASPISSSIVDAAYAAPRLATGTASFRPDAPDKGWSARLMPSAFDPSVTYTAYGATNDNTYSTSPITFQMGDADALRRRPGTVLANRYDTRTWEEHDVFIPQAEFDRQGTEESCE